MLQSRFRTIPSVGAMLASAREASLKQPFQDGVNLRLETLIFRPLQQLNGEEASREALQSTDVWHRCSQHVLTFPNNINAYSRGFQMFQRRYRFCALFVHLFACLREGHH